MIQKSYPSIIGKLKENPTEWWIQDTYLTVLENNLSEAITRATNRINDLILSQENFSVESNFLPNEKETILTRAINNNYKIDFVYMAMHTVEACMDRVERRTVLTGQFVSEDGIKQRYKQGLENINELLNPANKLEYKNKINSISVIDGRNLDTLKEIIFIDKWVLKMYDSSLVKEYSKIIPSINLCLPKKDKGLGM